jgi:hypothetical protein
MFPESGRQLCATQVNRQFTFAAKTWLFGCKTEKAFDGPR